MSRICLDCRTVLDDGEPCDVSTRHRVVALGDPAGRKRLVDEVWGPPDLRRRAKQLARVGATGGGAGAASQCGGGDCGGCDVPSDGEAFMVILVIIVAAIVFVLLYWAISAGIRWYRAKKALPTALGARADVRFHGPPIGRGRVVGEPTLESALGDARCVAWSLVLEQGRAVTLRDGRTAGFQVQLDDGQVVTIPAGRIRIEGKAKRSSREAVPAVETYVENVVSPSGPTSGEHGGDFPPVPFDRVDETLLRPGDVVDVLGPVMPAADPSRGAGYRENAMVLAPAGVPRIRVGTP